MFCYILVEEGVDEFFFIQDLHLNFHSFFGFQHGSIPSVQAIMWLLSLAIGLKCFWFLVALLLYPKSNIPELFFLDPRDLCLPNQFSRGSWQKLSVSTYLIWCQRINWVASMIWWLTLIFDPSYVCHDIDINIIWPASFVKFHCHYWTEFSQSWKDVTKTLRCHGNLQLLTDLINGANNVTHSSSRDWLFWMFMMSKSIHSWTRASYFGKMCKQHFLSF